MHEVSASGAGGVAAALVGASAASLGAASPSAAGRAGPSLAAATRALHAVLQTNGSRPGIRVPGTSTRTAAGLTQIQYYNWSGYADDNSPGKTYSMVSGSWTEPTVVCPTKEDAIAVFWVGLDGFNNRTVEQAGTLASCINGIASYDTWWEMFPTNNIQTVGTSVLPGDKITASVVFATGHYALTATDATHTANSFTVSETCGSGLICANASAEWIAETPGGARGDYPWPNFHTWKLTAAKVTSGTTNGVIKTFPDDEITIVGNRNESLATTGSLNTAGNSFGETWLYIY